MKGEHFDPIPENNLVTINGINATVLQAAETELKVEIPQGADTGPVAVTVDGISSSHVTFTYDHPAITSINPQEGRRGDVVEISGSFFGTNSEAVLVSFNGMQADVISIAEDLIKAEVPLGAGTGNVAVELDGFLANGPAFTYNKTLIISTLAGGAQTGDQDGQGTSAQFGFLERLDLDPSGNIIAVDGGNHRIRKITPKELCLRYLVVQKALGME